MGAARGVGEGRGGRDWKPRWSVGKGCVGWGLAVVVAVEVVIWPAGAVMAACQGDCNQDGRVTIEELVLGVRMVLGEVAASACFDKDGDGVVRVDEVVVAVRDAQGECAAPTPTPTPPRYCAAVRTAMSSGAPLPPSSAFSVVEVEGVFGRAVLADVNRDGWLDFVREKDPRSPLNGRVNGVLAVLGRGDGTFSGGIDIWESGRGSVESIAAADLDGDGLTDVVASWGSAIVILYATGDPSRPWEVSGWLVGVPVYDFQFGDINCDGRLDILAFTPWSARHVRHAIYMLLSKGARGFRAQGAFPRPTELFRSGGTHTVLADFSGDGAPDLLTLASFPGRGYVVVLLFLGRHCGGFEPSPLSSPLGDPPVGYGQDPPPVGGVAAGDLNGDGFLDLLVCQPGRRTSTDPIGRFERGELGVLLNRGDGTFAPERRVFLDPPIHRSPTPPRSPLPYGTPPPPGAWPPNPVQVAVGDFNHDGALDAVTSGEVYDRVKGTWTGDVTVFYGDGEGDFCAMERFSLPEPPWPGSGELAVADLNRDGLLDILATTLPLDDRGASVLLNRGTPTPDRGRAKRAEATPTPTAPPPSCK